MLDYYKIIKIFDEDFDEEKHPRDKSGKFVKKSKESQKGHNVIKNKKYSSEMVDPEIDKLFLLESKAYGKY